MERMTFQHSAMSVVITVFRPGLSLSVMDFLMLMVFHGPDSFSGMTNTVNVHPSSRLFVSLLSEVMTWQQGCTRGARDNLPSQPAHSSRLSVDSSTRD